MEIFSFPTARSGPSRLAGSNSSSPSTDTQSEERMYSSAFSVMYRAMAGTRAALDDARDYDPDDCYLLLNNGQRYASSIQSEHPVDSFCIWFAPDFAACFATAGAAAAGTGSLAGARAALGEGRSRGAMPWSLATRRSSTTLPT